MNIGAEPYSVKLTKQGVNSLPGTAALYITFICILCDIAKFLILNVIVVFLFGPVFFVHFITGTIILELSVKLSEFNGNFN